VIKKMKIRIKENKLNVYDNLGNSFTYEEIKYLFEFFRSKNQRVKNMSFKLKKVTTMYIIDNNTLFDSCNKTIIILKVNLYGQTSKCNKFMIIFSFERY
jgi:ABC-type antimicrobial peptide transport system ATPase subunit